METVIPPFLGHGHCRVMSWVVEEPLECFQTTQAVVKYSPAEGPWGDPVARMHCSLKLYVRDSTFAGLVPRWAVWLSPKPNGPMKEHGFNQENEVSINTSNPCIKPSYAKGFPLLCSLIFS